MRASAVSGSIEKQEDKKGLGAANVNVSKSMIPFTLHMGASTFTSPGLILSQQ